MPEAVRAYLRGAGYSTRALEEMEPHVREWDSWMRAVGEFYDYRDADGFGRVYQVHRRTIMPAMRVCREWGSLLLDEKTVVACESRECADWLGSFFSSTNFWGRAQETVVRAFGLGTGAFAVWPDVGRRLVHVRHYDAHGGAAVVGRRGRARVRLRHEVLLARRASRPAADARRWRARRSRTG